MGNKLTQDRKNLLNFFSNFKTSHQLQTNLTNYSNRKVDQEKEHFNIIDKY